MPGENNDCPAQSPPDRGGTRGGHLFRYFMVLVALLFVPALLHADVKEYTLDNGMKVLIFEDHKAPIATFQVWYKVGSRNEPSGKKGISHLLEHMMFKGTPRYGSKVFSRWRKTTCSPFSSLQPSR